MSKDLAGKRIRLLAQMENGASSTIPFEFGMTAGLEGTVTGSNFDGPPDYHQIYVRWDNGRSLSVMPYVDRYELIDEETLTTEEVQ